jgi:hypothetical protein
MAVCAQKGFNMNKKVLPPDSIDPLAEKALTLFRRLWNINPEHEICERWAELFAPQKPHEESTTIPEKIALINKKQTDRELYALCRELERILIPSLHFMNR